MADFIYTTAIKKLRKLTKRVRVLQGGSSAGKTYGILPVLIDLAAKQSGLEISVVSESLPHLRKGALKDFLRIMKDTNRYFDGRYNRTHLTYTFSTGSYIEFFSADQEGKVRGPRRTHLYINECNNLSFETYHQLAIRTSGNIWLDFNPSNEFWAHKELANDSDSDWLVLTYQDNEALPDSIIKELLKGKTKAFYNEDLTLDEIFKDENIKSSYWANWCKVYLFGLVGSLDGVVFSNWSTIDNIPAEAKRIGFSIDFGYTNDPTACAVAYEWNGKRIWDLGFYAKGLLNSEIARELKALNLGRSDRGYADSAEPKSIAEINKHGFTIKPVEKGKDSILFGIQAMQENEFFITSRSTEAIKELRRYCWDKNKAGDSLNRPIDADNHFIDAARYFEMMHKMKPKKRTRAKTY